jgi:hypothetical protein
MRPDDEIIRRARRNPDGLHPFTRSHLHATACALCGSRRRAYAHVEWQWRQTRPMRWPDLHKG